MSSFNDLNRKQKFQKNLVNNNIKTKSSDKIIFKGIVVDVDKYGGKWTKLGKPTPPNTLKAYIYELDSSYEVSTLSFYEPLLPSNISIPPQISEEVLVMFDSSQKNNGFWIRKNDSTTQKFSNSVPAMDSSIPIEKRIGAQITENGQPYEFKDNDETPAYIDEIPYYRKKSGDVCSEGRSNTLINQTFSVDSKKGVIDIITERQGDVTSHTDLSKIKEKEFPKTKGSRILMVTKYNIDKNEDWKLTEKPKFKYKDQTEEKNRKGDENEHKDRSYILVESDEFRFISRKSKEKLNNAILGNSQEIWLCSFMDLIEQMMDIVAENPSQQITVTSNVPNSINLMAGGMKAAKQKLKALRKEIHKHHSKHNFLN